MTTGSINHTLVPTPAGVCGGGVQPRLTYVKSWTGGNRVPGEKPGSPHHYSMSLTTVDKGLVKHKPTQSTALLSTCFGGPTMITAPWDNNDELKLLNKLAGKIRDHDFNAGIALGTGHQTIGLIGDAAARLAKGLASLKRGDGVRDIVAALNGHGTKLGKYSPRSNYTKSGKYRPRTPYQRASSFENDHRDVELSRRWLEASYGWRPLLNDVHGAAEALANHIYKTRQKKFRVTLKRTNDRAETGPNTTDTCFATRYERIIYVFTVDESLPSESVLLGMQNPATVLWELVPWSFAADWFLPIGDYLQALDVIPRLRGTYVRTSRREANGTLSVKPGLLNWEGVEDGKMRQLTVVRTVGKGLPLPRPTFRSPFSESLNRTLNQIALLAQFRSKGKYYR